MVLRRFALCLAAALLAAPGIAASTLEDQGPHWVAYRVHPSPEGVTARIQVEVSGEYGVGWALITPWRTGAGDGYVRGQILAGLNLPRLDVDTRESVEVSIEEKNGTLEGVFILTGDPAKEYTMIQWFAGKVGQFHLDLATAGDAALLGSSHGSEAFILTPDHFGDSMVTGQVGVANADLRSAGQATLTVNSSFVGAAQVGDLSQHSLLHKTPKQDIECPCFFSGREAGDYVFGASGAGAGHRADAPFFVTGADVRFP